jgi:hypothetical protein
MKRTMKTRQRTVRPGTVIDTRGITLSAGVALFDEVLALEAANKARQIEDEALGEDGPVISSPAGELFVPHPLRRGDHNAD